LTGATPVPPDDSGGEDAGDAAPLDLDLEDISVVDLCEAFARILETIGQGPARHEVIYDDTPIGLHEEDILDRLEREGPMTLGNMFVGRSRGEAIGLFLALLELVRQRRVQVAQDQTSAAGAVRLELLPSAPEEPPAAESAAPAAKAGGEGAPIEYEWPSEEARIRAERRAKLRATRAAKSPFGKAAVQGAADGAAGIEEDEIIDVDGDPAAGEPAANDVEDPPDASDDGV
jgi:hypothetical protein